MKRRMIKWAGRAGLVLLAVSFLSTMPPIGHLLGVDPPPSSPPCLGVCGGPRGDVSSALPLLWAFAYLGYLVLLALGQVNAWLRARWRKARPTVYGIAVDYVTSLPTLPVSTTAERDAERKSARHAAEWQRYRDARAARWAAELADERAVESTYGES